jgi:hypothetical protein
VALEWVGTAFGYAGVMANLCWPLLRERKKLLAGQVLACCLMFSHFALLGAWTGAAIMAMAGLQASLAIPLGTDPRFKRVYLASLLLTPVVCAATWLGPPSVFSSLALVIVCIANFQLDPVRQRALLLGAIFAWSAHNFLVGSVPGLVSNTLALLVSGRMLASVYRERKASRPAA